MFVTREAQVTHVQRLEHSEQRPARLLSASCVRPGVLSWMTRSRRSSVKSESLGVSTHSCYSKKIICELTSTYCTAISPTLQSGQRKPPAFPRLRFKEERDMSVKGCVSALWHHGLRLRRLVPPIVLATMVALFCGFHAPMARAASSPTTPIWSTQLDFDNNGTPWSESFFAGLASDGLTTAELT